MNTVTMTHYINGEKIKEEVFTAEKAENIMANLRKLDEIKKKAIEKLNKFLESKAKEYRNKN